MVFSGLDWCAPFIKLDKTIWQSQEFKTYADANHIVYKADFPKKKANQLPNELKKQNLELAKKFNQNGIYPLVLVMDSNEKIIGITGYKNFTLSVYISELKSFDKIK